MIRRDLGFAEVRECMFRWKCAKHHETGHKMHEIKHIRLNLNMTVRTT